MDIRQFLDNLSTFSKVDFKGKEAEFGLLAQKYDKNKNSIFESDELQKLQNDLQKYAKKDENSEDLSESEANNFLKSMLKRGQSFYDYVTNNGDTAKDLVTNLFSSLINTGIENDKEGFIKNKMKELENKRTFNDQFSDILSELEPEKLKRAVELFYVEGRKEQFNEIEIYELMKLGEEEFARAKTLFHLENNSQQFNGFEISMLAQLSDEELELAKSLLNLKELGPNQFTGDDLAELAKLTGDKFERVKPLCQLFRERFGIVELASLSDEEYERARTLFNAEIAGRRFYGKEIAELAKLSDEEFERARTLFNIEKLEKQFSAREIAELAKLSDEELQRALKIYQMENIQQLFNLEQILELAKLSDYEFNFVSKYFTEGGDFDTYIKIAKSASEELRAYLDEHPDRIYRGYTAGNSIKLNDNGNSKVFDNTGLIETQQNEFWGNKRIATIINTKIHVKQIQKSGPFGNFKGRESHPVYNDTFIYYDDKGNTIKTITVERNPENGFLNVSETDGNGNKYPIQFESVDSNTGAKITERHLTSPEGVKTDYYAEESDNLRVTEYKITAKEDKTTDGDKDKGENVLIYVRQTFEQISENKFISSINTTENPKDTHIYEIEYTEDNKVIILDKKNNETTIVDLKEYFTDEESIEKLLPVIKQLPGQILLEFAEKPFTLNYEAGYERSSYEPTIFNVIEIGNHTALPDEEDNIIASLTHELGHYLDEYRTGISKFANDSRVIEIYKEEFALFEQNTTSEQQGYISYFTNALGEERGNKEKIAETHSLLYSINEASLNMRRLYLAEYFPRTIAKIMELLLEEEGVTVQ